MTATFKPVSKATRNRRLLKLRDLLLVDARKKKGPMFDLHYWGVIQPEDEKNPLTCGTYVCAAGLAAVSGAFKKQGLSYTIGSNMGADHISITLHGKCKAHETMNMNGSMVSVCSFFGLTKREGDFLFVESSYCGFPTTEAAGERAVAKRIKEFVEGRVAA